MSASFDGRFEYYVGLRDGLPIVDVGITCKKEVEKRFLLGMTVSEIEKAEEYKGKIYPQQNTNILKGEQFKVGTTFSLVFPTQGDAKRYLYSKKTD